jgi:hypothetical protein
MRTTKWVQITKCPALPGWAQIGRADNSEGYGTAWFVLTLCVSLAKNQQRLAMPCGLISTSLCHLPPGLQTMPETAYGWS